MGYRSTPEIDLDAGSAMKARLDYQSCEIQCLMRTDTQGSYGNIPPRRSLPSFLIDRVLRGVQSPQTSPVTKQPSSSLLCALFSPGKLPTPQHAVCLGSFATSASQLTIIFHSVLKMHHQAFSYLVNNTYLTELCEDEIKS